MGEITKLLYCVFYIFEDQVGISLLRLWFFFVLKQVFYNQKSNLAIRQPGFCAFLGRLRINSHPQRSGASPKDRGRGPKPTKPDESGLKKKFQLY